MLPRLSHITLHLVNDTILGHIGVNGQNCSKKTVFSLRAPVAWPPWGQRRTIFGPLETHSWNTNCEWISREIYSISLILSNVFFHIFISEIKMHLTMDNTSQVLPARQQVSFHWHFLPLHKFNLKIFCRFLLVRPGKPQHHGKLLFDG